MPTGTETVLLVEDEDGVRELLEEILTAQGYRVLAASRGVEALQISELLDEEIHVLVTDVVMPHMSGHELAMRLRARRPALRVLYLSGYTDDAIAHHGVIEAGRVVPAEAVHARRAGDQNPRGAGAAQRAVGSDARQLHGAGAASPGLGVPADGVEPRARIVRIATRGFLMADVITRIPVVAGLAFERASRQPPSFEATLVAEPGNRYFPQAIAVMSRAATKLGYVAPELALHYFEPISASTHAGDLSSAARHSVGSSDLGRRAAAGFFRVCGASCDGPCAHSHGVLRLVFLTRGGAVR